MRPKVSCHFFFFFWGGGVGHVIFNLQLGVGHSVLCQMKGVGRVFSNHHILKCSGPPPPTVLFDQSLNVKLRAKLVVLSCCHSGRGKIKAEGVVGLARAFLGAGARSVLASLWAIDDKATPEFMKYFYEHLVKGQSTSKALNQAMKRMQESDDFSDVKNWAPFLLIGDDVTLRFDELR